jgi:hypothetical protein
MNRPDHDSVDFFVGAEVEHTPAFGKTTLFVIGIHSQDDIIKCFGKVEKPIEHIYFGANQSFPKCDVNDAEVWQPWEEMIVPFLQKGYLCTLDIDSTCAEGLCETGLTEYNNFIPMISVKLPYIQLLGYNATIKLDDRDFAATNPGVWCHSLHELRDRKVFTNWSEYTKDEIVK